MEPRFELHRHTVRRPSGLGLLAVAAATLVAGCSQATGADVSLAERGVAEPPSSSTTAPLPTTPPRVVRDQAWVPFATAQGLVLRYPSARVERVGFHESNHDGARPLEPLPAAPDAVTLEPRERGTGARTAADVVVDPDVAIRAPVSGRVLHAGSYVLYCDYSDDFVVIAPDDRPGWEVKILHIRGVAVRSGQRVEAGETVVAPGPTRLPFPSQVEEVTAQPPWPHVHIEVIDPTIRDRPSGRGC
ncbi:MAG: M23 family metallopeptidase [Actinomycetota bacterium]|nr:M23 family metallopeptidase [Actinomycetota bacterium]